MKKIKSIIVALFFCSLAYSQSFNKVIKSSYSEYYNGEWVTKLKQYPEGLYITMKGNDITINNDADSHYITQGDYKKDEYDSHICYTWNCINKTGESCLFMLKMAKDKSWTMVAFVFSEKHEMYEYLIDKQ